MGTTYIISSGVVSSGLELAWGDSITLSGGTAVDTILTDYSYMTILSDGLARNTVVDYGAAIYASHGIIENVTVNSGGWLSAGSQASATGIVVNSSGAVANYAWAMSDVTINSGGRVDVLSGTVTSAFINAGGSMYVANYGAVANNTVISGDGWNTQMHVTDSAWANSTTVESGYLRLSYGGVANDTELNEGGLLFVSSGAVAYNTIINSGASMAIEGGSADIVTVNCGGRLSAGYAWGMGSASGASAAHVRENGGFVYIGSGSSGTSHYDPEAGSWVYEYTYFPFPVEFASNSFGGMVYSNGNSGTVHSGTTATDISAVNGGLIVYSGGSVGGYTVKPTTWTSIWSGWQYTSHLDEETGDWVYESSRVSSAVEVTTLGNLKVMSGGIVTGLVAESMPDDPDSYIPTYLDFQIASGTVIEGTIDGSAFETQNGILSNAILKDAILTYMNGASVSDVTQINGSAFVEGGAYARNLNFSGGGDVRISRGAVVDGFNTFDVPYTYIDYGWGPEPEETVVETFQGASVRIIAGATVTNLHMGAYSDLTIEVQGGTYVEGEIDGLSVTQTDGYFGDTTINNVTLEVKGPGKYTDSLGHSVVVNGGTVANTIVNNGAVIFCEDYAVLSNITENGGAVLTGDQNGLNVIYSFASNTFSFDNLQGLITVHKNTVAQDNVMYGGDLTVYSGGVVNNFYVAGGMGKGAGMNNAEFLSGAIVSNFDTLRYSEMPYHPGSIGMADGVNMNHVRLTDFDGISMEISSKTVITDGAVDNIPFSVVNGTLSGFVGDADGWYSDFFRVMDGGQMVDCYLNGYAQVNVESGGSAIGLTMADNFLLIESGGTACNVTIGLAPILVEEDGYSYVDYNSAAVEVYDGAALCGFTVNELSRVTVQSGGLITGVMRADENAQITVCDGAFVDFDLIDPSALYVSRLDNFQALSESGTPTYTIRVSSDNQAAGTYTLANNAFFSGYKYFYVEGYGDGVEDYGFFEAYYDYMHQMDDTNEWVFMCHFEGNAPAGFSYNLNAVRTGGDDDNPEFDLVFTVESAIAPTAWLAAPTITASEARFTNQDVVLTISGDERMVTKEFSSDYGATWISIGDTITVSEPDVTYFFRGYDADGTVSEVTAFSVDNIDKVAPTDTANLQVSVVDQTVTFSWDDVTDDYSGVDKFTLTYWNDASASYTIRTGATSYVLEDAYNGTWHWSVQAADYAGNVSAIVNGEDFIVSGGEEPVIDLPGFLPGDFNGAGKAMVATVYDGTITEGTSLKFFVDAALWGSLQFDPGWNLLGCGDFDGNGTDDIFRINGEGFVVADMSNGDGTFATQVLNFKSSGWDVIGIGDFSGNGTDDILIANPTGASDTVGLLGYWESGVTWTLINGYSAEWECIATEDYNGDGKCDMLWRNSFVGDDSQTYNAYCTWIVDDPIDWRMVSVANPAEWNFLCSGDFNGDKMNDIAMINGEGVVGIWGVEDGWLSSWSILSAVNTKDWQLVGCDDFDGDGTDDIAWCSTHNGVAGYWQIEDKTLASWQNLGALA